MSKNTTRDEADNALEALRMIGVNAGHGDYSKTLAFAVVRRLNQQQHEIEALREAQVHPKVLESIRIPCKKGEINVLDWNLLCAAVKKHGLPELRNPEATGE